MMTSSAERSRRGGPRGLQSPVGPCRPRNLKTVDSLFKVDLSCSLTFVQCQCNLPRMERAILTDERWARLAPLVSAATPRGPPGRDDRRFIESVSWLLR